MLCSISVRFSTEFFISVAEDQTLGSGQTYKHFTLVNYDSMVVIWGIFPVRYNSRVVIYDLKMFIRLATGSINDNVAFRWLLRPLSYPYTPVWEDRFLRYPCTTAYHLVELISPKDYLIVF